MNSKGVALLIVAIVVLASLFFFVHITPPGGPVKVPHISPPKNISIAFFQNETIVPSTLDTGNATIYNFAYSGNATTVIRGTLINASTGRHVANGFAYISVYPAGALSVINNGAFLFTALQGGSGAFFLKVPGYEKKLVSLDLKGKTIWLNLSLKPAVKHLLSGATKYVNGTFAGNISLEFSGILSSVVVVSQPNGAFSVNLYNDSYNLKVLEPYLNPVPSPYEYNETGSLLNYLNVIVYNNSLKYNVSGYVKNDAGSVVPGAQVQLKYYNASVTTNSSGYYKLQVPYGFSTLISYKEGYGYNETTAYFSSNVTDFNITLISINPFNGSSYSIPPSLYNASRYLGNLSSSVNYSKKVLYILEGIINDSFDKLPVSYTNINFIVNVNGTYFRSNTTTSQNGSYRIYFSYPGIYKILVDSGLYLPSTINVTMSNPITIYNFSLTSLNSSIHVINGTIRNSISNIPIKGAIVKAFLDNDSAYFVYTVTNANGSYRIDVPASNYSVNATALGYLPNESREFNMTANITINLLLQPVSVIGTVWTNQLIPGLTTGEVKSSLTGSGNYTSASYYNLSLQALNNSSNASIPDTQFLVIYEIGGAYYYTIKDSNSTGFIILGSMEGGNYSLFVVAVNYTQVVMNVSLHSTTLKQAKFDPRQIYQAKVTLSDSFNSTNQNRSVPSSSFSITNSSLIITIHATPGFNGTVFAFNGWNATFNFSYINVHFQPLNESLAVHGAPVSIQFNVTPYVIDLIYNTSTAWFYSVDSSTPIQVSLGSSSIFAFAAAGSNSVAVNVSGSGHQYTETRTLTAISPDASIYFNVSVKNETVYPDAYAVANGNEYYNFTLSLPAGSLMIGGNISLNLTSSTISINDQPQTFSFSTQVIGSSTFSNFLLHPFFFAGGNVTMNLVTPTPANHYIMKEFNLYYYTVTIA